MSEKIQNVTLTLIDGGARQAPSTDYIIDVFGTEGYLAKLISGYQPRPGQLKLARSIDKAIINGHHVIGEGPTGVGKSLAYLVPAVFHAAFHGKKVMIVTGNKNLQRQIYGQDLADLDKAVPWGFTYSLRKGVSSYVCLRNLRAEAWRDHLGVGYSLLEEEMINDTAAWAKVTATGDYEESPGLPDEKIWYECFATTSDECDRKACKDFIPCHVRAAKEKAEKVDLVVTNYHLFFLHRKNPDQGILPNADIVIFDEAHKAAGIARDFMGDAIGYKSVLMRITGMKSVDVSGFKKRGGQLAADIRHALSDLWNWVAERSHRKPIGLSVSEVPSQQLEMLLEQAEDFWQDLHIAVTPSKRRKVAPVTNIDAGRCETMQRLCVELRKLFEEFRVAPDMGKVYYAKKVGEGEKRRFSLESKQIDVTSFMRHRVFESYPTVVQTSATLAIRGDNNERSTFAYQRSEMGMGGKVDGKPLEVDELVVESPFDWDRQALLVIPETMPDYAYDCPRREQAVCDHFEQVVNTVKGRTLGLFSSFRMLKKVRAQLDANTDWRVLAQKDGPNRMLNDEFKSDISSVLLGCEVFSEGFSVEGEACTCVIIDKIPFVHGDDPILWGIDQNLKRRQAKLRAENKYVPRQENAFTVYQRPQGIISFKQRVGRLIRTVQDVGVVVVLDSRLAPRPKGKNYREMFLRSIPPMRLSRKMIDIELFLRGRGAL